MNVSRPTDIIDPDALDWIIREEMRSLIEEGKDMCNVYPEDAKYYKKLRKAATRVYNHYVIHSERI